MVSSSSLACGDKSRIYCRSVLPENDEEVDVQL